MAKVKDLANLKEGDKILVTDHEWQMNSVECEVRDTLIPDEDGVEWVRVFASIGDGVKLVTLFQSDVAAGITEIEKL